MKLFNTLTNKKEEFKPISEERVSMYVCGPTVYGEVHIGNMRPVVIFDCLNRFLSYLGYDVLYVSNVTDVDNKIIDKALEVGETEKYIAEKFLDMFIENVKSVGSKIPDMMPKVTDNMKEIISFIESLVNEGYAYEVNGNVYFSIETIGKYGELSNQAIEDLLSGARIEVETEKRSPIDFTLWKKTKTGIMWDSPWGKGRPGWHTECVSMINTIFKDTIDIHCGGADLKFPHHENEIAQNIAYAKRPLANYWLHNGRLLMDNEKMSKSVGNVIKTNDFISRYSGQALRLLLLGTHYRQPLNYTDEVAEMYNERFNSLLRTWKAFYYRLELLKKQSLVRLEYVENYKEQFEKALNDDLNTSNALTVIYDMEKELNKLLRVRDWNEDVVLKAFSIFATFEIFLGVLGFEEKFPNLTESDFLLIGEWKNARENKNYSEADNMRMKLLEKGIMLM